MHTTESIGFIGQGWIGKHYADDFENRGYSTVRYALEEPYISNKDKIADCRITFIAVPTPTRPDGFDATILREALTIVGDGKIAVVKSTTTPGLIEALQTEFSKIILLHSPEFLVEKTAAYDAAHPNRNIIGLPTETQRHRAAAAEVLRVLPEAPYEKIMSARESELVKYAGNCFLYTKILFMNVLYDVVEGTGGDFETIREAMVNDPRISDSHTQPIHDSGRGAGGHCFIKDFEAFVRTAEYKTSNDVIHHMLRSMTTYNNQLLQNSGKDLDLLQAVYGV